MSGLNDAIKLAIKGGWKPRGTTVEEYQKDTIDGSWLFCSRIGRVERLIEQEIILDPLFWISLGKALGWKEVCAGCGAKIRNLESICDADCDELKDTPEWKYHALRFFELKLSGGSEEEFWNELLTLKQ